MLVSEERALASGEVQSASGGIVLVIEGEVLSSQSVAAIQSLLTLDPADRPGFLQIQQMDLFKDMNWSNLLEQEAPFIPQPEDETDTGYFDARNQLQHWQVSQFET